MNTNSSFTRNLRIAGLAAIIGGLAMSSIATGASAQTRNQLYQAQQQRDDRATSSYLQEAPGIAPTYIQVPTTQGLKWVPADDREGEGL